MPFDSAARAALLDISQNIDLANEFLAGRSYLDFENDTRTMYAVTCCLEIISEAPVGCRTR
jgi:uncharacterized protein with HEPN domain